MKVYIAGIDGYLGWSLAVHLVEQGHEVAGCDNFARRCWVKKVGSHSAIPIMPMSKRLELMPEIQFDNIDLKDTQNVYEALCTFKPDAVVHLGENPSAPYSMIGAAQCNEVQANNILGTNNICWAMRDCCPDAHLIKLGTMGEYGTPPVDIPEGLFILEYRGKKWNNAIFPRQPGSCYHASKVADTVNVEMFCRIWGLRSTDIMQGVVFGTSIPAMQGRDDLRTRFDFDEHFGTVINRYCAEAVIGAPLTIYGTGEQQRGFLPLKDSMRCFTVAINNPPEQGEYRVFNQFENVYSLYGLALMVREVGETLGLDVQISNIENPRVEAHKHYYNPDRVKLLELGYQPTTDIRLEIYTMLQELIPHADRIREKQSVLIPATKWKGQQEQSKQLVAEKV